MDHDAIRQKLSAYLDGAVSPAERALLEKHLAECEECRKTLRELERTVSQVRNLGEMEPPPWLTARVMARVREEAGRESGILRRLLLLPLRWRVPLEAAALVFVTVTGYLVYHNISADMKQVVPLSGDIHREASAPAAPPEIPARDSAAESATARKEPRPTGKEKPAAPPVAPAPSDGLNVPPPRQEVAAPPLIAETAPRAEEKSFEGFRMAERKQARSFSPMPGASDLAANDRVSSGMLRSKSLDIERLKIVRTELSVDDPDSAEREIVRETARYGGVVVRNETAKDDKRVIVVRMRRSDVGAYLERLESLGKMSGTIAIPQGDEPIELHLTLVDSR